MIDELLRPTGPGPRPPTDGFVQALRAGRRKRWRTVRNNVACGTAALAAIVGALVPRLSVTSFAGLEPTRPPFGITEAPRRPVPTPSPTPSRIPEARDPEAVDDRPGYDAAGPAGHAPAASQPAAPGSPAGPPHAEGSPAPAEEASGAGQQPEPQQTLPPPAPDPEPSPTQDPPVPPDPEPIDLTYEDQSTTAPCQGSAWCWSAQVVGSYTLRLKACRGSADTQGVLQFGKENEADFRVVRDGTEVWRWSVGQPDPDYLHPVPVDRWQCAVWSTRWSGVAQDGAALPAGTYRLDAISTSTSVPAKWWSASFSVT